MKLQYAGLCLAAPLVILGGALVSGARAPSTVTEPTVDEVRSAFVEAGFVASMPVVNLQEDVVSFSVVPADGTLPTWGQPTLRVFVYPDEAAAQAAHRLAQARDEGNRSVTLAYSDDRGPQLLSGYGLSVWRHNVALIQVAPIDETGAYPNQIDCDMDQSAVYSLPRTTVARAFVAPLETMLAARQTANQ
jgi:hypothetical protein